MPTTHDLYCLTRNSLFKLSLLLKNFSVIQQYFYYLWIIWSFYYPKTLYVCEEGNYPQRARGSGEADNIQGLQNTHCWRLKGYTWKCFNYLNNWILLRDVTSFILCIIGDNVYEVTNNFSLNNTEFISVKY